MSRIGLDLRSNVFAHGQLYVALSRAQNRRSIMCLLPPTHVLNGVPHTANVVYSLFVEAATGDTINRKPLPPSFSFHEQSRHTRNLPTWSICRELGDDGCGFRALARQILGDPSRHPRIRQEAVQYLSSHRDNPDFNIISGIDIEPLHYMHKEPHTYTSYDDYLHIMSSNDTFMLGSHIL